MSRSSSHNGTPVSRSSRAADPPQLRARRTDTADGGTLVVVEDAVLTEISHELGNLFHKLYHWSDYFRSGVPPAATDSSAADMLERTIRNLEDFLKVAFQYFSPIQLNTVHLTVDDLLAGFLSQLSGYANGMPVEVSRPVAWDGAHVLVDLQYISQAFQIAARRITQQPGPHATLHVHVGRGLRGNVPGVELDLAIDRPGDQSGLFRGSQAGIEWAVADRLFEQHGGELEERQTESGTRHLVLFLPLST
jgi:hypothetical protein